MTICDARRRICRTVALSTLLLAASLQARAQSAYTVTDMGVLPGVNRMLPQAINAGGQVTGRTARGSGIAPSFRTPPMTEIQAFEGEFSIPYAINDAGYVVGFAFSNHAERAFLWQGGDPIDFTKTPGSKAYGINNLAMPQVVGSIEEQKGSPGHQAFVWQDGNLKILPALPGGKHAGAYAVNDAGQIAGYSSNTSDDATNRAVLWPSSTASSPVDLGLGSGSTAVAINASGTIIGAHSGGRSFTTPTGTGRTCPGSRGLPSPRRGRSTRPGRSSVGRPQTMVTTTTRCAGRKTGAAPTS